MYTIHRLKLHLKCFLFSTGVMGMILGSNPELPHRNQEDNTELLLDYLISHVLYLLLHHFSYVKNVPKCTMLHNILNVANGVPRLGNEEESCRN